MEIKDGFFTEFINAIFNFKYYINFKNSTVKKAFGFLFILALFFGVIEGIGGSVSYIQNINRLKGDIKSGIIDFEFKNGEVNISKSPYILSKDENLIFIDTNLEYKEFNKNLLKKYNIDNKPNVLLIFKDKLILINDFKDVQKINFGDLEKVNFGTNQLLTILAVLKAGFIFIILYQIAFNFIGLILSSILIALIGLLISILLRVKISIFDIYKVSVYCLVLPTTISTIFFLFKFKVPYFYIMYILLSLVYLIFVIKELKDNLNNKQI